MTDRGGRRWLLAGTILAYLLIGLEVFIMITPFALFFYSVYGPVLDFLAASALTGWTVEFFLPHLVFTGDPLIRFLLYLQVLFPVGLALFLAAAIPLYIGRFTRRGVVKGGFYSFCRHPQYLFLAISGFGLLIYWPRFIILFFYVTMLFVYYLLARNEEWRMKQEAPGAYEEYMAGKPMFLPGEPGGKLYRLLLGWISPRWMGLGVAYLLVMGVSILVAVGIRSYTVANLPQARLEGMTLVSVYPRPDEKMESLYRRALSVPEVRRLTGAPGVNLAYLLPGDYFLTGLVLEEGPRFSETKLERFPELLHWRERKFQGGIEKFFRLFFDFVETLGSFRTVYDVERFIFVRVTDYDGEPVPPDRVLGLGFRRLPAVVVDLDYETQEVLGVLEVSGDNLWGRLPMPNF